MELRRALVSVFDTSGLSNFVEYLKMRNVEVLATKETAAFLREVGMPVLESAGLFSLADAALGAVRTLDNQPIDMLVVNLPPPFKRPARQMSLDQILDGIDLVRPSLLRVGACRYSDVAVVPHPDEYDAIVKELVRTDDLSLETRRRLAVAASTRLAVYEAEIGREISSFDADAIRQPLPDALTFGYERFVRLRQGDNAFQEGTLYGAPAATKGTLLNGMFFGQGDAVLPTLPQASDASRALSLVSEFEAPAVAIFARQRPVAAATGASIDEAFLAVARWLGRSISGAVLAANEPLSPSVSREIAEAKLDLVVAPSFDPEGLALLKARQDLCIIATGGRLRADDPELVYAPTAGGALVQPKDTEARNEVEGGEQRGRRPSAAEERALAFAWRVAKHAISDAAVVAVDEDGVLRTTGIGAAALSRGDAIAGALRDAGGGAEGGVLASDGPIEAASDFEEIARRGVTAVAHAGSASDSRSYAGRGGTMAVVATGKTHYRY